MWAVMMSPFHNGLLKTHLLFHDTSLSLFIYWLNVHDLVPNILERALWDSRTTKWKEPGFPSHCWWQNCSREIFIQKYLLLYEPTTFWQFFCFLLFFKHTPVSIDYLIMQVFPLSPYYWGVCMRNIKFNGYCFLESTLVYKRNVTLPGANCHPAGYILNYAHCFFICVSNYTYNGFTRKLFSLHLEL